MLPWAWPTLLGVVGAGPGLQALLFLQLLYNSLKRRTRTAVSVVSVHDVS